MDLRRTPASESRTKVSLTITTALVSAVLEWMLIFMLFIDASFSFLVTKFARYCQLQVPCLFCSRLDHVLGSERAGFYWELICHKHKLKISSLICCQLHSNLVDIRGTCETCLFSFATIKNSNLEIYRLLIEKLGDDPYYDPSQAASSDEHKISGTRRCTCCNEQWIPGTCTKKLFSAKSVNSERAEVIDPSSSTSKCNGDEVQEAMEGSSQRDQACNQDAGPLPHIEYTKIKLTSDTESEGPFSDNGSVNVHVHTEIGGYDSPAKCVPPEPKMATLAGSPASEKLIHPAPPIKSSLSELEEHSNLSRYAESKEPFGHDIEECDWQPADFNNNVSQTSELVSSTKALVSPCIKGTHYEEPKGTNVSSTTELEKEVHVECGEVSNLGSESAETTEFQKEVATECGETSMAGSDCILEDGVRIDLKPNKTDTSTQMPEALDLVDAYKLAVGTRGRQLSGKLLEQQRSMADSTRASEDVKLLLSQITAARGIDIPLYDMSPRVSATSEDFKAADASSVIGMQMLQRRISLERNESNLSLDGSVVSEIDGESAADHLKRQVEHDKKIMSTLYKELEEERNAAAIAANQAMAMITRLQEEKAALNMEALQCLRMMEEQAEYDEEALLKANDLLSEKEKQIQNFDYELRLYQEKFGDIPHSNNVVKPRPESDEGEVKAHEVQTNYGKYNVTTFRISMKDKHDITDDVDGAPRRLDGCSNAGRISPPMFEDEKQFILHNLRKLEEKLIMFSEYKVCPELGDGAFSTGEALELNSSNQLYCTAVSHNNGRMEKYNLPGEAVTCREASSEDLSGHKHSDKIEGFDKFISRTHVDRDSELDEFRHELSVMNNRLEALEAEQNVIECSINSLEKGSEGFEFIQEIAVRVQELHLAYIGRSKDLR